MQLVVYSMVCDHHCQAVCSCFTAWGMLGHLVLWGACSAAAAAFHVLEFVSC
jgi:hypothetical protein